MSAPPAFGRVRTRWLPLWILGAMLLLYPLKPLLPQWGSDRGFELILQFGIYAALMLWAEHQCERAGVSVRDVVGRAPRSWREWRLLGLALPLIPLAIGGVYLLWVPLSFVVPGFVKLFVLRPHDPIWDPGAPIRSALFVLVIVVIAPIVEEIVFRGVLLHRWSEKWGARRGLLCSSLAFGVLHADVLGHTVFGIVMALLYVRTRSLWLPIGCHMLTNALAVGGSLLPWGEKDQVYTLARFRQEWYLGALALAVGLPLLYALRQRFLPPAGWRPPLFPPGGDSIQSEGFMHVPQH
jgi:uncharacterized protein